MKKIGILYGRERAFPEAFVEQVNRMNIKGIEAEAIMVDVVQPGKATDYAVILDRISEEVPFYRAYLKNAASSGTAVINNPFWLSADEKFFHNTLAVKIGVPVPKTVILPSHERPTDTQGDSFSNLKFPLSWDQIFAYIGWPAYLKPHTRGGWRHVYKLNNPAEFFEAYRQTGQWVMLLQEEIQYQEYYHCYGLGQKYVKVMQCEPRYPHPILRGAVSNPASEERIKTMTDYVLKLNQALGYDFNMVEIAVRDGIPYAIDVCNPALDIEVKQLGQENFDWLVEHTAKMAVERAKAHKSGGHNLTWGTFVSDSVAPFLNGTGKKPGGGKKK